MLKKVGSWIGSTKKYISNIYIMFHTISPAIVRQINELQKAPEIKDKQLEKAEKKVIEDNSKTQK